MTLETLAKDIAKSAEAEASAMLKSAKDDAKAILAEQTPRPIVFARKHQLVLNVRQIKLPVKL